MGDRIVECTLDDLLREVLTTILRTGEATNPTKGAAKDVYAAALTLENPRARLSRTEGRGRLFSCLGEFVWYLSGSNALDPIAYYIPAYREYEENGLIYGGYGPRLFRPEDASQMGYIVDTLRRNPSSRKAVVQLFDRDDVTVHHDDVPCTCTLQFLVRGGRVNLVTYMRSNDAWLGLTHDVFCFTMLQEMVATSLGLPLGTYEHFVGSLHLYDRNLEEATAFLDEGWQSTATEMPGMPPVDPWLEGDRLVRAEREIREGRTEGIAIPGATAYWDDLIRILRIYSLLKSREMSKIEELRRSMHSRVFDLFISEKTDKI